jgi:hypothetical protein
VLRGRFAARGRHWRGDVASGFAGRYSSIMPDVPEIISQLVAKLDNFGEAVLKDGICRIANQLDEGAM